MVSVISTKESIMRIKNQGMEYLRGRLAMFIKEIIVMILGMAMGRCIGVMGVIIKGNGSMVYNMGKVKYM